jgi:hypothetical protein
VKASGLSGGYFDFSHKATATHFDSWVATRAIIDKIREK